MIKVLQEFKCYIEEVLEKDYLVILKDLTNPSNPEECAEMVFPFKAVLGEIFYFSIEEINKTICSVIYFPKPKIWTQEDINIIEQRSQELFDFLNMN